MKLFILLQSHFFKSFFLLVICKTRKKKNVRHEKHYETVSKEYVYETSSFHNVINDI